MTIVDEERDAQRFQASKQAETAAAEVRNLDRAARYRYSRILNGYVVIFRNARTNEFMGFLG